MPLFDDHHGVVGPAVRPQALTSDASATGACPAVGDEIVHGEDVVLDACARRARCECGDDGDPGDDMTHREHRAPFDSAGFPRGPKDVRAPTPRGFTLDISCAAERPGPVAQLVFKTGTPA